MKTDETKMKEAVDALMQLNFHQLLVMQANLSEHVLNCYNYHASKHQDGETSQDGHAANMDSRPFDA